MWVCVTNKGFDLFLLYSYTLIHLLQRNLDLILRHRQAHETGLEHAFPIDPRMHVGKEPGAIAAGAAQQLGLAAGVIGQVGGDVVDLGAEHGPGVAALAAIVLLEQRGRHAQVRDAGGQAIEGAVVVGGEGGPVERRVAGLELDFLPRLGGGIVGAGWVGSGYGGGEEGVGGAVWGRAVGLRVAVGKWRWGAGGGGEARGVRRAQRRLEMGAGEVLAGWVVRGGCALC